MIRRIGGIVAGYAIFVVSSLALFKLSGQNPHADPAIAFVIIILIYGAFFSGLSGFTAQLISKTANLKINYMLAFVIAGFAAFSFLKSEGNHWTQILAIFIFAPASVYGGMIYNKRNKK